MINIHSSISREKSFRNRVPFRSLISYLAIMLLAFANLSAMVEPAKAISVDASAATFNFDYANKATIISGTSGSDNNAVVKYTNITDTPLSGISIDAVVKTTLTNSTVTNYDNIGNASSNIGYFQANGTFSGTYGIMEYTFEFYESGTYTGVGTGIPVALNNVSITSIDLDGSSNFCQFTDFTGYQSYVLSQSSSINVLTNATDSRVPVGTTRFIGTSCGNNSNLVTDAVQVQFDSVTTFKAKFGLSGNSNINYFGIAFEPMPELFVGSTLANPVANPSNQPPTSTNTTRYYVNGESSIVQLQDFGTFADPDGNPFIKVKITSLPSAGSLEKFVNGSWVAVALNDEILVSDISNGNLRYTGTANSSLQFKVSDGSSYSSSAYTMTLLVSNQNQTITFNNPGTKTPTAPNFASGATSTSGLTVTLTSLTPGVCAVSGLNIDPIATGTCTIVATQAGNSTYGAAAPVTQTFPISTLTAQTITAPSPGNQTWGGSSSTITVTPTASSNLTVSLVSLSPAVCTVSGLVITIVGPGNCSIRNSQAGNGTYAAAPPVEYTFVVGAPVSSFTLTYNDNSKTGGAVPVSQTGNGNVTLATNSGSLVRTGYTFSGWNTLTNGNGTHYAVGATYNLTADATLYAEWTALSFTITYDDNDSTGGSSPANTTGYGTKTLATNSGTLVKTGFIFKGWNTLADGSGTRYNVASAYSLLADVTLYAEWVLIPAIIYSANGATGGETPEDIAAGDPVTIDPNTGNLIRAGFRFLGWNTQPDGSGTRYEPGMTPVLPAGTTLYAEWQPLADGLANTGGEVAPVLPLGLTMLTLGAVLATRRKRAKKH